MEMVTDKQRVVKCVCLSCGVIHYRRLPDSFVRNPYTWKINGLFVVPCELKACEEARLRILRAEVKEARERYRVRSLALGSGEFTPIQLVWESEAGIDSRN